MARAYRCGCPAGHVEDVGRLCPTHACGPAALALLSNMVEVVELGAVLDAGTPLVADAKALVTRWREGEAIEARGRPM